MGKKRRGTAKGHSKLGIKTTRRLTTKKANLAFQNFRSKGTYISPKSHREITTIRYHSPSLLGVNKRYKSYKAKKSRKLGRSKLRYNTTQKTLVRIRANKTRKKSPNSPDIINPGSRTKGHWRVKKSHPKRRLKKRSIRRSKSIKSKKSSSKSYGSKMRSI